MMGTTLKGGVIMRTKYLVSLFALAPVFAVAQQNDQIGLISSIAKPVIHWTVGQIILTIG